MLISHTALNYAFVGTGYAISAVFLFRNLYPVVSATDARTSKILLVVVVALHAGLAIAIKILFFAHASPATPNKPAVDTSAEGSADKDARLRLVRMLFRV